MGQKPHLLGEYAAGDHTLVTVYASGYVRIWKGEEIALEWMLPTGSPRSVAAHPSEPVLAIGCKGPGRIWVYQVDVGRMLARMLARRRRSSPPAGIHHFRSLRIVPERVDQLPEVTLREPLLP